MVSILSSVFSNAAVLVLVLAMAVSFPESSAARCVAEFEACVTDTQCCGWRDPGALRTKCLTGHVNQTATGTTCKSLRSQALDDLYFAHDFDHGTLVFLLELYFFHNPEIKKQFEEERRHDPIEDRTFFIKMAKEYGDNFAKLVVGIEKKYKIKDLTTVPILIRDFLSWRDQVDIKGLMEGKYDDQEYLERDYRMKGGGWDEEEE
mmetsp:Transcript_11458/g.32970  ORF Transcript_11458/g.32970 Transcript_11458/m.32970 type:complete len:205 (-) Transcript_11458:3435-4049(-)